jgi:hypothetical protein
MSRWDSPPSSGCQAVDEFDDPAWSCDSSSRRRRDEVVTRIRSVLVGVDVYERPDVARLDGCVNDVFLVRRLLKDVFGVPNEDIRVVVNERATRDAIVHRLRTTIRDAEEGDVVVFFYSGHGSQIRDRSGDELSDRLDELICPYDMDWDRRTYILDDDLDALFGEARPGVLVEAFFDCCFYGANDDDVRYLPPPFDLACRVEGDEDVVGGHGFRQCGCFAGRNVLWSASAEGQEAAEDDFDGQTHGVFTYSGCRFIEENVARVWAGEYSREQLLEDLHVYMRSLGYSQSAELGAPEPLRAVGPFRQAFEPPPWMRTRRTTTGWTRRTPSRQRA